MGHTDQNFTGNVATGESRDPYLLSAVGDPQGVEVAKDMFGESSPEYLFLIETIPPEELVEYAIS